jgi:CHASE2 domain-containing sensor protein
MSTQNACELAPGVVDRVKKFRFAKTEDVSALILKVDKAQMTIVEESFHEGTLEALVEDLPENQPRFIVLSFKVSTSVDTKRGSLSMTTAACRTHSCWCTTRHQPQPV